MHFIILGPPIFINSRASASSVGYKRNQISVINSLNDGRLMESIYEKYNSVHE